MNKEDGVYIYIYIYIVEYYTAVKKNEILPFATTWMELECVMLSEIRERQISYDFTHMWNLRYKTVNIREGKQK